MPLCPSRLLRVACLLAGGAGPLVAQGRAPRATPRSAISAESLRVRLFALADDSMKGRDTGDPGNVKAAEWIAALFARYGLEPAGTNGGWFQTVVLNRLVPDTMSALETGGTRLRVGRDILATGVPMTWAAASVRTVFGGEVGDTTTWLTAGSAAGKLVVIRPRQGADLRAGVAALAVMRRHPRFAGAAGFAMAILDAAPPETRAQVLRGRLSRDTVVLTTEVGALLVTVAAAETLLGARLESWTAGQVGPAVSGSVAFVLVPMESPARNVVGILRGTDPALRQTYVSLTAHNDHVGFNRTPVDHDSTRAFNTVVRPLGADSPNRPPTPDEAMRFADLRDSLRRARPPRLDSIFNGADDDGSGTVALLELARVLGAGPRPRRSLLFVSHAAEERGLLGSQWYTDHPTVPLDSIIAEIDEDMIGRGGTADLPDGGPGYLEIIGARRLSPEFGDTLEAVNARQAAPFRFNYAYDAPGHPLQYYCRADHYSYARYGIPAVALSRGEHMDYHQVTDEPQYIDYAALARVAQLVHDAALALANMDHRPLVTGARGDPRAPCRQ